MKMSSPYKVPTIYGRPWRDSVWVMTHPDGDIIEPRTEDGSSLLEMLLRLVSKILWPNEFRTSDDLWDFSLACLKWAGKFVGVDGYFAGMLRSMVELTLAMQR
jgi:hypothetical protein